MTWLQWMAERLKDRAAKLCGLSCGFCGKVAAWVNSEAKGLNNLFGGTLQVHETKRGVFGKGYELEFWEGDKDESVAGKTKSGGGVKLSQHVSGTYTF